jgi:ankyrin repeat protein
LFYFSFFFIFTAFSKKAVPKTFFETFEIFYLRIYMDLVTACKNGDIQSVRLLLEDPHVNPADDHNQAIIQASAHGHEDIVRLLMADPRVNPADENSFALYWASINGYDRVVRLLLTDQRINPVMTFLEACEEGQTESVRILLADPRVDPAVNHNQAIIKASSNGHVEIVRLLMADPRVNPADGNNKAIYWATINGYPEVVRLLLTDPRINPVDAYIAANQEGLTYIALLLGNDLRIAMFYNNHDLIRSYVESNIERPPIGSLAYTIGNEESKNFIDELYTQRALIQFQASKNKVPKELALMISRYGKKSKRRLLKKVVSKTRQKNH